MKALNLDSPVSEDGYAVDLAPNNRARRRHHHRHYAHKYFEFGTDFFLWRLVLDMSRFQATSDFIFAGGMLLVIGIFALMSVYYYDYVDTDRTKSDMSALVSREDSIKDEDRLVKL